MILTLIAIGMIVLGVVLLIIDRNTYADLGCGYSLLLFLGIAGLAVFGLAILISHSAVDLQIQKDKIEYESLCKRLEVAKSEYEDISKSDIIADVAKWNADALSYKYWTESPWTDWFHSKEIADALRCIPLEQD